MSQDDPIAPRGQFKDRTIGLILFGLFEILIGGFFLMMIPMVALSALIPQPGGPPMGLRMMIPAMIIYALVAVVFTWLGVGSMLARRWARALMLVISWLWLVTGIVSTAFFLFFMPDMFERMAQQGQMPAEAVVVVKLVVLATLGFIYVILPGVFVLFYQSEHVRATCEFKDPRVRWTDHCPLPVLALVVVFGFSVCSMISMPCYGFVVPVFGTLLTGLPGALVLVAITLVLAYLTWGLYKLRPIAWWVTLALGVLGTASNMVTFSRVGLMELYEKMNMPEQQLKMIQDTGMIEKMNMPWMMAVSAAVFLGYLLYVKRYFAVAS